MLHQQIMSKLRCSADLEEEDHVVHAESPRLHHGGHSTAATKLQEITNVVNKGGDNSNGSGASADSSDANKGKGYVDDKVIPEARSGGQSGFEPADTMKNILAACSPPVTQAQAEQEQTSNYFDQPSN